ncbi:MAG: ABC transporter permease [Caldilineales bacterium]|nr:ABC transporter permease [Caldilineales bacterium]
MSMIIKNLWRRRLRSLLTMLGIAAGVAAVVGLNAMAAGLSQNYTTAVGMSDDLLVSQANAIDVAYSSLDEQLGQRIAAVPGVTAVEPGVYGWISTPELPFLLIFGYEPGASALNHYRLVEGKPLAGARQILLGRRAAESLDKKAGETVRLNAIPYQVVGVYETGQGMEESGGVVSLVEAQDITQKERNVSLFQVGVSRGVDLETVKSRIAALDKDLSVATASDREANAQWSGMMGGFAWGLSAIAILIGGLGMMNAMVMTVLERTREIGVLRALGWRRGRVVGLILGEALALSLLGGLLGLGLGVLFGQAIARIPGFGAMLEGSYSPKIFVQGMVTAVCLGLLGGLYPAWTAANLLPVEALRYEGGGAGEAKGVLAGVGSQSFRNLWRRRNRTLISATGIGIGVATLIMLGGLIDGVTEQMNSLAGSAGAGNITIMQRDVADLSLSSLDERMVSQIAAMPGVRSVSPMVLGFVMTPDLPLFMVGGIDPNSAAMRHYKIKEGRSIRRPHEILLGTLAAKTYKLKVGEAMTLYDNRYQIVGLVETGVAWEDGSGMLALREAERLFNRPRNVSFIFVDVADPRQAEAVVKAIERRFPDAQASLSSQFAQNTDDMARGSEMMNGIGLLALLVGGIVVANTMMMSIYERTREIGALRAMGWRRSRILGQIVEESLLLCLLAALLGSLIGVVFMQALAQAPILSTYMQPLWQPATFIQAVILTLVVGLLAGAYPAWRASRLLPVEALRYE